MLDKEHIKLPNPEVEIIILSCDRPDYCRTAVISALSQNYEHCKVTVSDNSSDDRVVDMLSFEFPHLNIIKRRPQLPALDHFKKIISESEKDFLVMFHDDDVLLPDYSERLVQHFQANPEVIAVACDAQIIRDETVSKANFMGKFDQSKVLKSAAQLIECYFKFDRFSPPPFPSYMYKTSFIRDLSLNYENGGKYSDVSFLVDLIDRGNVLWLNERLIQYRFHGQNDSGQENIAHRLKLLHHLFRNDVIKRKSNLHMDYRFNYCLSWLRQNRQRRNYLSLRIKTYGYQESIIRSFLFYWGLRLALSRIELWGRIFRMLGKRFRARL